MLTKLFIQQINLSPSQRRDITSRDCLPSSDSSIGQPANEKSHRFLCPLVLPAPGGLSAISLLSVKENVKAPGHVLVVVVLFSSVGLSSVKMRLPLPTPCAPPASLVGFFSFFLILVATKNLEDMIKPWPCLAVLSWSIFGVSALGETFLPPLCLRGGRKYIRILFLLRLLSALQELRATTKQKDAGLLFLGLTPETPEWGVGFIALVPLPRNMPVWDRPPRSDETEVRRASVKTNFSPGVSNLATKQKYHGFRSLHSPWDLWVDGFLSSSERFLGLIQPALRKPPWEEKDFAPQFSAVGNLEDSEERKEGEGGR